MELIGRACHARGVIKEEMLDMQQVRNTGLLTVRVFIDEEERERR